MTAPDNVIALDSLRVGHVPPRKSSRRRSVRDIAVSLTEKISQPWCEGDPLRLEIGLRDLCGIEDATIVRLSAAARAGILTSASAARLALRHAEETARPRGRVGQRLDLPSKLGAKSSRNQFVGRIDGIPPNDFCLRIQLREASLRALLAPLGSVSRLYESGPSSGGAICIFYGPGRRELIRARLLRTADWHSLVDRTPSMPALGFADHVVVLHGEATASGHGRHRLWCDLVSQIVGRCGADGNVRPREHANPASDTKRNLEIRLLLGTVCPHLLRADP